MENFDWFVFKVDELGEGLLRFESYFLGDFDFVMWKVIEFM